MTTRKRPWRDPAGRFSALKATVFAGLFLPGLIVALDFAQGNLGARPVRAAEEELGLWTLRLIFLSLAVTPFARAFDWPRLVQLRRMTGVAAFAYAITHFVCYIVEQRFVLSTVASEIALRLYLTIGFLAVLGLTALAATSTDAMIRRLGGRRWRALHRLTYAIAILAVLHFFMQARLDAFEPTLMAGLLGWLLGYRVLVRMMRRAPRPGMLAALGIAAGLATMLGETTHIWIKRGVPVGRILEAQFSLGTGLRPGWVVLGIGLAIAAAAALRLPAMRRIAA